MKKTQKITVSIEEYASMKQELLRLRGQAKQAEAERLEALKRAVRLEAEKQALEAEKTVLQQTLEDERNRLRKIIKEFVARRSRSYKAGVIAEGQLSLFVEQLVQLGQSLQASAIDPPVRRKPGTAKRKHPGRRPIGENLPRLDVLIEPEEDVSACVKIGEEITEELDYVPGHFFVRRFIRPKYARPQEAGIAIGPAPLRVIDKGIPGPMLLAYILVSKYADHLPLYRQLEIFKRSGIDINDVTLNGWVKQTLTLLEVIYRRIRDDMLKSGYLMADETTIKVLDKDKKGSTHLGYYWAYLDPVKRSALFIYEKGRAGSFVRTHLNGFRGFLQTDAYSAYDSMPQTYADIIMMGCWTHVRRKFIDALAVERSGTMVCRANPVIIRHRAILPHAPDGTLRKACHARTCQAHPARNQSPDAGNRPDLTPSNVLNTAIRYTLNQWDELLVYTTNGALEIDNNLVENSIRPIALGRKNYLFAGNHEAAQRNAVIYSILATCKACNINPGLPR
ncbi:MAG: IS66 family transposase [Saprospirales bacterium]|nr:IS66 family transposase [Saprospirales bacterium]